MTEYKINSTESLMWFYKRRMPMSEKKEWTPVNFQYKARIFEMLYSEKQELLDLYNAVNGTAYKDPDELEINTLENAIYMSMHNDVSFVVDMKVSLYEHQSTYSPNLPLRYLFYISDLYSKITKDSNLYGERIVKIPTPKFIIFYNGEKKRPEKEILKLSSMYLIEDAEPGLELEAILLNINPGYNENLKGLCKSLHDYAEYTSRVREYAKEMEIEEAVEKAITECIAEGILAEFLSKSRAEVKKVSIYEYDQEKHLRMEREDAKVEGRNELLEELVRKKLQKNKSPEVIAEELEENIVVIKNIIEKIAQ